MEPGWFFSWLLRLLWSIGNCHSNVLVAEFQPRPVADPPLVGMKPPYGLAFRAIGSHWLTKCGGLDLAIRFTQGIF